MRHLFRTLTSALLLIASTVHAGQQPDDKLRPGDGAVLLTVSVDYPTFANANGLPGNIPALTVERIGTGKAERFVLPNRLQGLQQSRAYAGSLPPGRYRIHDIMGSNCKLLCGDGGLSMPKNSDLAEFVVESGSVRYLGSVLVSVQAPVPPSKKWSTLWAYTKAPDAATGQRLLDGLYPELAKSVMGALQVGWEPNDGNADAARDRIRRTNSGLFEPSPFNADGFFFGALNGVIKRWNRQEGVRLIDTGSPFLIRSVLGLTDGQLLAGGEASTLLYSSDAGRSWRNVAGDLPYGIIMQIRSLGGDELVFSLQHGTNAALYRGKFGDTQWTKLGEWPMEFATWTGLPGMQPELQVQGRRIALTLPSKKGVFLDLDSGDTHAITPPGSIAFFTFSPDGVMRCTCFRSIAANPWESRDLGKTWIDSPLDRWMLLPVFRDALNGFSYKGALFSKSKMGVTITRDGGRTWTQQKPPTAEGGWWRPAYSADGSIMLLSGIALVNRDTVEQVHWSSDEGANWTLWSNEGKWLYEHVAGASAEPASN